MRRELKVCDDEEFFFDERIPLIFPDLRRASVEEESGGVVQSV